MSRSRHQPPGHGFGKVHLFLARVLEVASRARDLARVDVERRGQARARRFGQHSGDVVERGDPVEPEMSPSRILAVVHYSRQPGLFRFVCHFGAVPRRFPPYQRIGQRPNRLGVGRVEDPCAVAAHVMKIEVCLGLPFREQHLARVLRLLHVHGEGIAVVVVADVLVVQPRRRRPFIFGSEILVVEVGHHDLAVRIEAGNQQEDDIVEDPLRLRIAPRHQLVGELGRHLSPANLGGVHAHRHCRQAACLRPRSSSPRLPESRADR